MDNNVRKNLFNFYPRPPGGGRPLNAVSAVLGNMISIHALRVEGDGYNRFVYQDMFPFLSTPSGWRATDGEGDKLVTVTISIHALRVEGDMTMV